MNSLTGAMDFLVELELRNDNWDQFPMLFIVNSEGKIEGVCVLAGDGHPVDQLRAIVVNEETLPLRGVEVGGIVVLTEGWGLKVDPKDKPAAKAIEAWRLAGRRIADHPDRVECKTLVGVGPDGMIARQIYRDEATVEDLTRDGAVFGGAVPDAVVDLYAALAATV